MVNRRGKWKQRQILFLWAPKSLWILTGAMKLKDACSLEKKDRDGKPITNLDSIFKSRDITLPTKVCIVEANGFSSSYVQI